MYDEKTRMEDMRYAELEYAREEGLEKGREEGISLGEKRGLEQGLEKGRREERTRLLIQSIKGMIEAGLDKKTIQGILNITEQEFDNLVIK